MWLLARCTTLLFVMMATACAAQPPIPPGSVAEQAPPPARYKAVLIAGERNSAAFDHATKAMRDRLIAAGTPASDIQRLTATRSVAVKEAARPAGQQNVLSAIASLHPAAGEGCFVFATSHGAYRQGLVLAVSNNFLAPAALDRALTIGCGDAPTVVIISGCFSGNFTWPPMNRQNRVILTAARVDRPSFGCGAQDEFTVFDRCLLGTMNRAPDWPKAYGMIQACVSREETELQELPSGPQAWFGDAVRDLPMLKQ